MPHRTDNEEKQGSVSRVGSCRCCLEHSLSHSISQAHGSSPFSLCRAFTNSIKFFAPRPRSSLPRSMRWRVRSAPSSLTSSPRQMLLLPSLINVLSVHVLHATFVAESVASGEISVMVFRSEWMVRALLHAATEAAFRGFGRIGLTSTILHVCTRPFR